MRRMVLVFLVASGCQTLPVRHVYVPKGSARCWRECMLIFETCRLSTRFTLCENKRADCNLSCDGSRETIDFTPAPAASTEE